MALVGSVRPNGRKLKVATAMQAGESHSKQAAKLEILTGEDDAGGCWHAVQMQMMWGIRRLSLFGRWGIQTEGFGGEVWLLSFTGGVALASAREFSA